MTFTAASFSSSAFAQTLSPFLCAQPEASLFAESDGCLLGSTFAYGATGFLPGDAKGTQDTPFRFVATEAVPECATPENAHRFPALLREIEDLEATINRAKDPWTRGVVSLFLLAHSGKFHDYVTRNGQLSEAGRDFLATIKGADREIDPALLPASTPPASEAEVPKPAAAPAPRAQPAPQAPTKITRTRPVEDTFSEQEQRELEQCFRRLFPTRGFRLDSMTRDKDIVAIRAALARPASRQFAMDLLAAHRTSDRERHRKTAYECLALASSQTALDWFAQGLADKDRENAQYVGELLIYRASDPQHQGAATRAQYAAADMLFSENRFAPSHAAAVFERISQHVPLVVSDRLVRALGNQHASTPLTRALMNAAKRIDTRLSVYQALLQGLAHQDVNVRTNVSAIIVKLLGDEKIAANTEQWLLKSSTDRDAQVRAGIAIAYGKAAKEGRPFNRNEREMLEGLSGDRDANVRKQAAWALEQGNQERPGKLDIDAPQNAPAKETDASETANPKTMEQLIIDLRNERDDAKWKKARPALVATLCELPAEQRMEAVRETLMHESEYYGPMRIAEVYADIAARVPLSAGEIAVLLERRTSAWSALRENIDPVLNTARTVLVRGRFLSRDAYFDVMKRAIEGAYDDAVMGRAQHLLDLAARNNDLRARDLLSTVSSIGYRSVRNNDLRARDLLYDQDKTSELSPSPASVQRKATPDTTKTAPLILDPQELLKLFLSNDIESRRGRKARIDRWLEIAKGNPHEAHRIRESMRRTARLEGIDPHPMFSIVDEYFKRFLFAGLLRQEDIELLMDLERTFHAHSAGFQIRQILEYARAEAKFAPLIEAAQAARAQRNATPAGASQPETAPLLLDAQELLKMFQDGLDGLSKFRPHLRAWLDAASHDAEAAKEIWKTVQRIVKLAQDDEVAMYRIVGACLKRFLEADVLTQNTVELLLELRKRFRGGSVGDMIAREWHNYLSVNPKVGSIAQAAQADPTLANSYLAPAKLAAVFDQGHHINMGPVNELLDYAKTNPAAARAATSAMWQAVELLQGNDFGLLKIVRFGLREFAREHLLSEGDYEQLLILEQGQRPRSEIQHEIEWMFQVASLDPEKMQALVRAKQSLERRRGSDAQGPAARSQREQQSTDLQLDPVELAESYIHWDVFGELALRERVDQWIAVAKKDPRTASRIREAMRHAVELVGDDLRAVSDIVEGYFKPFLTNDLLAQEDIACLLQLEEKFCQYRVGRTIRELLDYDDTRAELAPLIEAAKAAREQMKAGATNAEPSGNAVPYVNATELAELFRQDDRFTVGRVQDLLAQAKTSPENARKVVSVIWQAVERLYGSNLISALHLCLHAFAHHGLLQQVDRERLNALRERYPASTSGPNANIQYEISLVEEQIPSSITQTEKNTSPDSRFDPKALAGLFRMDSSTAWAHVDGLISLARSDVAAARDLRAGMWQAIEISKGDRDQIVNIINGLFDRLATRNLLLPDDWARLMRLRDEHQDSFVATTASTIINVGKIDPQLSASIATAERSYQQQQETEQAAPPDRATTQALAELRKMPFARRQKIESLVQDLLHGNTKARKKAAAEWAKFVGERNADTHAMPMLVHALRAADGEALEAATPFLANAIAKETNWPEKKRKLVEAAHASNDPYIRSGAARILAALARLHEEK
jgi:hypothetical protein